MLPGTPNSWNFQAPRNDGWVQIVGVISDTPNDGLRDPVLPTVYVPFTLVIGISYNVVVRTQGNPLSFVRSIRERVHRRDADQMTLEMHTAEEQLNSQGFASERFVTTVFLAFAFLATTSTAFAKAAPSSSMTCATVGFQTP